MQNLMNIKSTNFLASSWSHLFLLLLIKELLKQRVLRFRLCEISQHAFVCCDNS